MKYFETNSFARLVELLNLRVLYDDLVINGDFFLPKKIRGQLTIDKAKWIEMYALEKFGSNHERIEELIDVACTYIELAKLENVEGI